MVTTIEVQAAQRYAINVHWGDIQLEAVQYKAQIKPGETLFVDMKMDGNMGSSRKLSARLVDPAGVTMAQTDKPLGANMRFDLALPAEAMTGTYHLVAVPYNAQTLASIPDSAGKHAAILATVDVMN